MHLFSNFSSIFLLTDKPRIAVPLRTIRTERNHYVWCSATGIPSINISLFNSSTALAHGIGMVGSKITQDDNYTCMAENDVGIESKTFPVALSGKISRSFWLDTTANKFLVSWRLFLKFAQPNGAREIWHRCLLVTKFHLCLYEKKKKKAIYY